MASDLSNIVQDTLVSTLNTNISKEIKDIEVLLSNKESIKNKNLSICPINIAFQDIKGEIKFIYPALTSSFIFNCIMMEDSELLNEINDDIKDAINEINNQISGILETSINASELEDIKECKTSTDEISLIKGSQYTVNENNFIILKLGIDDKIFDIYLEFNDTLIPYLNDFLSSSKESDSQTVIDDNEEQNSEDSNDDKDKDNSKKDVDLSNTDNNSFEDDNITQSQDESIDESQDESIDESQDESIDESIDESQEDLEEKKNKKLKILIISIGSLLAIIIITIFVMYFMGMFDPVKIKNKDTNTSKPSKRDILLSNIKNKQIIYNSNMVDVKKLNKRLALLTKYEILEEDILANYEKQEKERLYKLKMEKLEEFALRDKEEYLFKKDIIKTSSKENRFKENNSTNNKVSNSIFTLEKLTFIQIDAPLYKKYKKFINQEKTKQTQISMCRYKFKTKVYIGPLYVNALINNIMNGIDKNDAKLITISKKEFDKRCDF